jgi:SAM-dependent methyltransferase
MKFQQLSKVSNRSFRDSWVDSKLLELSQIGSGARLLDVGAGESPYKLNAEKYGFIYESHDFNQYKPTATEFGFQDPAWIYPEHKYVCDILDIPEDYLFDVLICTEVFEHIPDPVAAFKKLSRLIKQDGHLLITVPIASHIHQAPYYFSSGLSPYWFNHWSKQVGMEILTLQIQGDYVDRMKQDMSTLLNFRQPFFVPGLARAASALVGLTRFFVSKEVLQSTGFGTIYVGKKVKNSQ